MNPIEIIIDAGSDCEDKAAIRVALLNIFGFDAMLISLSGHEAAAISCSDCGGYYTHNQKKYSFIETTYPGWCIGCVPPEYKNTGAIILEVADLQEYKCGNAYAYNGNNKVNETPFNYNGRNAYSTSTSSKSSSTVIINGAAIKLRVAAQQQ